MTTASVLDRVASHVGRASTYTVCELDGRVVHTTTDSEEATRVLSLDPSRRCVVRDGAVLRWGANVPAGEKSAAMVFLRKVGLVTGAPVKSHAEMRERIAAPRLVTKPAAKPTPPASKEETMPSTNISHDRCQFEGCTDEIGMIRSDTVESRRVFCRRHRATMRHREKDAKRRSSKAAAKQAKVKKPAESGRPSKSIAKTKRRAAPPDTLAVPLPSASSIEYHLQHAQRCVSIVAQLGGIERAEKIAEALA